MKEKPLHGKRCPNVLTGAVYTSNMRARAHVTVRTHPLLVQFQELLGDFGRAERQPQARDVELRDDLLQHLLEWQAPDGAVPPRGGHGVLENGASQGHQLSVGKERERSRERKRADTKKLG